jgi:hypothetical protein
MHKSVAAGMAELSQLRHQCSPARQRTAFEQNIDAHSPLNRAQF